MHQFCRVAAVVLVLLAGSLAFGQELRVMTFNIRYDTPKDGENAWPKRKELFFQTIEKFNPDLLGLQEVRPGQERDIREHMKDYEMLGVGRDDGKGEGERASVLFRRDRFEKVREGTFWLSETPDTPSKGWDADLPRICSWVELRDKQASGKPVVYLNTHWDHKGREARAESARVMAARIGDIAGDKPVVITGDFNTAQDSEPYKTLLANHFVETWAEMHPQPTAEDFTFHGFTGRNDYNGRIDWVLRSKAFRTKQAEINRTSDNGRYPSDHFPVQAVLEWVDPTTSSSR